MKNINMNSKLGNLAILQAKNGKEKELAEFLKSALPLAQDEIGTTVWFAFEISPGKFGIFDTYPNEEGRQAHLTGEIAKALFARAEELLEVEPQIEMLNILAAKDPK